MMEAVSLCVPDFDLPGVPVLLTTWRFATGQRVVAGERLVEVTAGDVTVDLPCPASGILIEQCAAVDDRLEIGQLVARVQPD